MSPKTALIVVGLVAPGMLGWVPPSAASPPVPEAPPSATSLDAPSVPPTVLLLSNGRVLKGPLTEDESGYSLLQSVGTLHFSRREVEKTFGSMAEVYRYKESRLPPGDPEEHLQLAFWCMEQNLEAEAEAQLAATLELEPGHRRARDMVAQRKAKAEQVASRAARASDSGVVRTRATVDPQAADPAPPNALDAAIISKATNELGLNGLPVIFDLPQALAVKRASEFSRLVHPVLQRACAGCHNERHPGPFQLAQVKNRRELSQQVYRTNLDATLGQIDPANLGQSPVLTSAILPHGGARKPVFSGYNDPSYKILSAWVRSLGVPAKPGAPASPTSPGSESFAADREGVEPASATMAIPEPGPMATAIPRRTGPAAAPRKPAAPAAPSGLPPDPLGRLSADDPEFPVSPLVSGAATLPASPADAPPPAEGMPPFDPNAPPLPPEMKVKRKAKINNNLLQKMLMNRNGPGSP